MSKQELDRVEVLARVRGGQLRWADAGVLLRVSHRRAKRLWKRCREEGAAGLKDSPTQWWIVRIYLTRWKIKQTFRFVK